MVSDRIMEWLDESQQLADQATEGPWGRYSRDFRGERSHSVKTLAGSVVAHSGFGPDGSTAFSDAEFIAASRTRFPQAVAALREVAELHRRESDVHEPDDFCAECSSFHRPVEWPCPTIRAIADALALEGDDDDGMG